MPQTNAERIADRMRCLYAAYLRGHAEATKQKRDPGLKIPVDMPWPEQIELCQSSLEDPRLASAFTAEERALISAKPGKLRVMDVRAGIYCADSIDILAEALGGIKGSAPGKPAYCVTSNRCPPSAILGAAAELAPWLAAPRLLPKAELRRLVARTEAYTWRLRVHTLTLTCAFRSAADSNLGLEEEMRLEEELGAEVDRFIGGVVAKRAARCKRLRLFEPIRGDFPVGRRTFKSHMERTLLFAEREEAAANQRLRAALWLLDPSVPWLRTRAATPMGFTIPTRLKGDLGKRFLRYCFDPDVRLSSFHFPR